MTVPSIVRGVLTSMTGSKKVIGGVATNGRRISFFLKNLLRSESLSQSSIDVILWTKLPRPTGMLTKDTKKGM